VSGPQSTSSLGTVPHTCVYVPPFEGAPFQEHRAAELLPFLPLTALARYQKQARGEETERVASSAAQIPEGTWRAAAAWQQLVETLLGYLLGTRVTGVHRQAQMVCARRVETGRGLRS